VLRGQSARTGGGLLFASPEEFADGAERLLDDPALAGAMGRAARDHVQREYRWDDVEARLRDLITRAARP
jgi:glycosyltransferase involved in cell wall biosynthesis